MSESKPLKAKGCGIYLGIGFEPMIQAKLKAKLL